MRTSAVSKAGRYDRSLDHLPIPLRACVEEKLTVSEYIWEGTTDMMAHDVLRVVCGKLRDGTLHAVGNSVEGMLGQFESLEREGQIITEMWTSWKKDVLNKAREELELVSRALMERLGDVVMGTLLVLDAGRSRDTVAMDVLRAWLELRGQKCADEWKEVIEREKRIVFGFDGPDCARTML